MDPYKSLLASASREHVKRSSALASPLVGNVFLPAIQSPPRRAGDAPRSPSSGASAQHLKVIEQCIAAENRREAQLASCQSVRERRRWTRKFQAQREHERALIEALMIPPGSLLELELKDLDADSEAAADAGAGWRRSGRSEDGGGLTASVASPDRLFRKAAASSTLTTTRAARPHARKKFSLPECHGSPGTKKARPLDIDRRQRHGAGDAAADLEAQAASRRERDGGASPPARKRSPSRSASPVRSGSMAPGSTKASASPRAGSKRDLTDAGAAADRDRRARATAKARVPPLASLPKPETPTSPIKKSRGGARAVPQKRAGVDSAERSGGMTLFDGARSFEEVQRLARAAGVAPEREAKGEEKETQTSGRDEAADAALWAVRTVDDRRHDRSPEHEDGGLSSEEEAGECARRVRPHSSPPLRSLTSLGLRSEASKDVVQSEAETLESSPEAPLAADMPVTAATDELGDDEGVSDEMRLVAGDAEVDGESAIEGGEQDGEGLEEAVGSETSTFVTRTEEGGGETEQDEKVPKPEVAAEEELDGGDPDACADDTPLTVEVDEEELETDVAEVLFDLVDLVADAIEQEQPQQEQEQQQEHQGQQLEASTERSESTEKDCDSNQSTAPSPPLSTTQSARSTPLASVIGPIIRVQALFRGHNSRRAFRLALYQEALRCGMLGAMPGTAQGASGWYQDPKSLVAYYFVVDAATGEWEQKRELRCRRLVLTPFEMLAEMSFNGEGSGTDG